MRKDKVIYRLTIADVQTVAQEQLERNLTAEELKDIDDLIAERINWYEIIESVLCEKKFD